MSFSWTRWLDRLAWPTVLLCTFIAYTRVLGYEFLEWDDNALIVRNPLVQGFHPSIFWTFEPEIYSPLALFTFQFEHWLAGFDPRLFHATNLLLHLFNIFLAHRLIERVTGNRHVATAAAAVFALHPVQVESVAWVSARKELLWTLFGLCSLLAYQRNPQERAVEKRVWLAALWALLAMLSKPTAVVLPFIMLLLDWKEGTLSKRSVRKLWPLFGLALLFSLLALLGKTGGTTDLSVLQRLLIAVGGVLFALKIIVWPMGFAVIHPAPEPIALTTVFYASSLVVAIVIAGSLWVLRNHSRETLLGAGLFLLAFLPGLFSPVHAETVTILSEHYLYFPMIGAAIVFTLLLRSVAQKVRISSQRVRQFLGLIGFLGLLGLLSGLSWHPVSVWADSAALFEAQRLVYPRSVAVLTNLGAAYASMGKYAEAESVLRQAIGIDPDAAQAHFNIGGLRYVRGDYRGAIASYERVLALKPNHIDALRLLTWSYYRSGDIPHAREYYDRAIREDPAVQQFLPDL